MTAPGQPDPVRVTTLAELGLHLDALRRRAAYGTGKSRIGLDTLARRVALPRSTVHVYVTGRVLPPAEALDQLVIALGATADEQRAWAEAWFRVSGSRPAPTCRAGAATRLPPRQLPPAPRRLLGREAELGRALRVLRESAGGSPAVLVHGLPGVGKTALALRIAWDLADTYPDGHLYVDLAGEGGGALPPAAVLERFLRALGVASLGRGRGPAELSASFRTCTAPLRVLVLLDNAQDGSQVRPLLTAAPGSATLVTSRQSMLDLDVDARCQVAPLTNHDATAMLVALAGKGRVCSEPEATARVVRGCGGLPLALHNAGKQLASRSELRVSDVAARIARAQSTSAGCTGPLRTVQRGFDSVTRLLSEPSIRALAGAVRFGCPDFAPWLLAPLAGVDLADTDRMIDELVSLHLIQPTTEPPDEPRYRLHDLSRVHADLTSPPMQPAIDWVLELTAVAHTSINGHLPTLGVRAGPATSDPELRTRVRRNPLTWVSTESATVLAAVDHAEHLGRHDIAAQLRSWSMSRLADTAETVSL